MQRILLSRNVHRKRNGSVYRSGTCRRNRLFAGNRGHAWGDIFTACYPVREDTGEVIGAICMEMDMEHTYKLLEQSNRAAVKMAMFAAIVLVLFALGAYCLIQKK